MDEISHSSLGHLNTWSLLGGSLGRIRRRGLDGGSESLGVDFEYLKDSGHFY